MTEKDLEEILKDIRKRLDPLLLKSNVYDLY